MKGIGKAPVGVKNGSDSEAAAGTSSRSAMCSAPRHFGWYTMMSGLQARAAAHSSCIICRIAASIGCTTRMLLAGPRMVGMTVLIKALAVSSIGRCSTPPPVTIGA